MNEVCERCRFSVSNGTGKYECRKGRPMLPLLFDPTRDYLADRAVWPVVSAFDFCGEWESK